MEEQPKNSRKVCLYLGDIAQEVEDTAKQRKTSKSKLLVEAWELAKARIAEIPTIPTT